MILTITIVLLIFSIIMNILHIVERDMEEKDWASYRKKYPVLTIMLDDGCYEFEMNSCVYFWIQEDGTAVITLNIDGEEKAIKFRIIDGKLHKVKEKENEIY